jgi:hypothetical protein
LPALFGLDAIANRDDGVEGNVWTPMRFSRVFRAPTVLASLWLSAGTAFGEPPICAKLPGTAEQVARTPRANENLELLAISLSDGITADDEIYRRLVRDIAAIRTVDPRMRTIEYSASDNGELMVGPVSSQKQLFLEGRYTEWDCLNRYFHVSRVQYQMSYATLQFAGRFNLNQVGELYSSLAGVRSADPNGYVRIYRPPSIYVLPASHGWRYVLDGGACGAANDVTCGLYYFIVSTDGVARFVEEWRPTPQNTPELEPGWVKDAHAAVLRESEKRYRESQYGDDNPRFIGNQGELGNRLLVRFKNPGDLARYLKHNEKAGGGPLPDLRPATAETSRQLAVAIVNGAGASLNSMIPPDDSGRIGFYVELPQEYNPRVAVMQSLRGDWRIYSIETVTDH